MLRPTTSGKGRIKVITGYNTDVEFDGVVYHVQTEDKGLQSPVILSLVYSGGAILASKRSPYDDLVARGFDEQVLSDRLKRQHKLICAAVHAGRIEELKKLSSRDPAPPKVEEPPPAIEPPPVEAPPVDPPDAEPPPVEPPPVEPPREPEPTAADRFAIAGEVADEVGLSVMLSGSPELRGGTSVTLRLNVLRQGANGKERVPDAKVTVKTLGSSFPPQSTFATTDKRGAVAVLLSLPDFKAGRAAVLIQAESHGEIAELRKIILPSRN